MYLRPQATATGRASPAARPTPCYGLTCPVRGRCEHYHSIEEPDEGRLPWTTCRRGNNYPSFALPKEGQGEVPPEMNLSNTLVMMACSASKRETADKQDMPLIDLYNGPLWQTLRVKIGRWPRCPLRVVALSGRYGIVDALTPAQGYEARLTSDKADRVIRMGLLERQDWFGELPGDRLAPTPLSATRCPVEIDSTGLARRRPWKGVVIAGSGEYRRVFTALLSQLLCWGHVASNARVFTTCGSIGIQRSQLGTWLEQLGRNGSVGALGNAPLAANHRVDEKAARDGQPAVEHSSYQEG